MENEQIKNENNSSNITFGSIIRRERKKSGKSLKEIEKEMTVKVKKVKDGKEVIEEDALITASYLNRIENENRVNVSFNLVCLLIKKFNLDLIEVFKSFGYGDIIANNMKQNSIKQDDIETILKETNFEAPIIIDGKEEKKVLTNNEKDMIATILNDVFKYGISNEESIVYVLTKLLNDMDCYKKSRKRLADDLKKI
ncbi:hypothetical protein [Clostridium ljungdahlii]|uniref:HTH cro/C1-type domain-containing protein n=1 Tax=Clostridium ljungdahlii TaxID=1538 RepID=A0A162KW30_9CLOT|nr:hypothetical protein [Clostridium ljungdahlii]OAA87792.1 hypothetical protein WY13_01907 [Clostridium ljungdahlii]